jgi:pantoate--beta-alanine ligase
VILASTRLALAEYLAPVRGDRGRIGFVPTMGYLHEGHLSLVDLAREKSDFLVVSIFVNPLQFGPEEDLDRYPRDLDRDMVFLKDRGVDLVFHPSVGEMYPAGDPQVSVDPGSMGQGLCGRYRPGHFRGVLTVVARLFGLLRPQAAVFGQKDYQQAVLIRRMVQDLELGVEVILGPSVREADGLALSSRNVLLSPEERRDAPGLHRSLQRVQKAFGNGERSAGTLRQLLEGELMRYPHLNLQYGEVIHPETLEPLSLAAAGSVVAVAAFFGATRLIDNHILTE